MNFFKHKYPFAVGITSAVMVVSFSLLPIGNVAAAESISKKEDVIVVFKEEVDPSVVKEVGGQMKKEFDHVPIASASVPADQIQELKNDPNVETVEKNIRVKINSQTQDWGIPKLGVTKSWTSGYTGKGVKIAVLDTGIAKHEDVSVVGGISTVGYTKSYGDDNGHGTHVTGIIGAKNNGIGTVGIAPDASLYAVKVLDSTGEGYLSDIIAGIDWSITNKMDIINMSLGTKSYSVALEDAVNRATKQGIVVVAAAGNEGNALGLDDTVEYPAKFPSVIAVSAVDQSNKRGYFSATGSTIEVAAPGVNVLSTYPGNGYAYMSGTSMASPYVAGDLALLKQANPTMNVSQLRTELQKRTIDLGNPGRDSQYGFGLIQAPSKALPQTLGTPASFKATNITQNTIGLSWTPVSGATTYELKRNGVVVYSGKDTTFVNSSLYSSTNYYFELLAINEKATSKPVGLTVKTNAVVTKPSAPANFKVTQITDSSISFNWARVSNATEYVLKRNGVVVYRGTSPNSVNTKLQPKTSYKFELTAVNRAGTSNPIVATVKTNPAKLKSSTYANANTYKAGQHAYVTTKVLDPKNALIKGATVQTIITAPNGTKTVIKGVTSVKGNVVVDLKITSFMKKGKYTVTTTSTHPNFTSNSGSTAFIVK